MIMDIGLINRSKCLVLLGCLFCFLHTSKGTTCIYSFSVITFGKDSVQQVSDSPNNYCIENEMMVNFKPGD